MQYPYSQPSRQRGVTLIELMVGIAIGLLTVAVAMGALMVSRGVSGTVSDASEIQQQASYAFRVLGRQLRQAGSLRLKLSANQQEGVSDPIQVGDPVAFELDYTDGTNQFTLATDTLSGMDAPTAGQYKLTTGYRNYTEPVYHPKVANTPESLQRNCVGGEGTPALIQSAFVLNTTTNELRCSGNGGIAEPILRNVANFQVRYLLQTAAGTGNPNLRYVDATTVGTNWGNVFGVEVCLVLYGNEPIDLPAGSTYTDCDGSTAVTMNTLAAPRNRRMHMVFRNVYQLRSQGLIAG